MPPIDPVKARDFATSTVKKLREAGFEALWAGGCVRDMLMGREPKDYDVATNALPHQLQEVFGYRRTLAIGASFGVIVVVGPSGAGQIDVATFRRDAAYSDGRHPDSVTFSNAEEDAQRRDFTINGLFYDPLESRVIDYVGGQVDLQSRLIRAIGDPSARFQEDYLRVLRAVRFATTLDFEIDTGTLQAVQKTASRIRAISAERITEEMRRILISRNRRRGLELLKEVGLLHEILPESDEITPTAWQNTLRISDGLRGTSFVAAMSVLLREIYLSRGSRLSELESIARAWRMSNDELDGISFCLQQEAVIRGAPSTYWPKVQRTLIDPRIDLALNYAEAVATVLDGSIAAIEFCRERLSWHPEKLNPKPLVGGHDLSTAGIPRGPLYKQLLDSVRDAQLMGQVNNQAEAMQWVRNQWAAGTES